MHAAKRTCPPRFAVVAHRSGPGRSLARNFVSRFKCCLFEVSDCLVERYWPLFARSSKRPPAIWGLSRSPGYNGRKADEKLSRGLPTVRFLATAGIFTPPEIRPFPQRREPVTAQPSFSQGGAYTQQPTSQATRVTPKGRRCGSTEDPQAPLGDNRVKER